MNNKYDGHFKFYSSMFFENQVAWPWFKAQAMAESSLMPEAVSPAGAQGIMQLMPGTSKEMAERLCIVNQPFDPRKNIMMGIGYAKRMWDVWKAEEGIERLYFAFASYNAGLGNILKAQELAAVSDQWDSLAEVLPQVTGKHAEETINYVKRIERFRLAMIEI